MNHWLFSNKPEGAYGGSFWDMATILKTHRYSIRENENNRRSVRKGDVVYMRTYGRAFIGKFTVSADWQKEPDIRKTTKPAGTFSMADVEVWSRPLPQNLVIGDLSNKNHRRRIIRITAEDGVRIETAQRVYARLGFGSADENVLILEKGLEEAIKPSLRKLGLKLAGRALQQQFGMGIGVGRSDLICLDERGDLVVLELKRGMTSDEAIGQVWRYVGWLRENVAKDGQQVRACIVTGDYDEQLRLAAMASQVRLVLVRLG